MVRTSLHILCLLLIGLLCMQCSSNREHGEQNTRNLEHIGVFWTHSNSDILVNLRGFYLRDSVARTTLSGVKFRTSEQTLIIESAKQQRSIRLVDSGELEILGTSVIQWDLSEVCVVLHITHRLE